MVRRPQVARCKSSPLRPRSTSPTCMEVRTSNATRPLSSKERSDGSQADRSAGRPGMRKPGGKATVSFDGDLQERTRDTPPSNSAHAILVSLLRFVRMIAPVVR